MANIKTKTLSSIICPHCGKNPQIYDLKENTGTEIRHPISFTKTETGRRYVCPECHLPIPLAYLQYPTLFVSFYGKPSAGKTHILTVMTKRIVDYLQQNEGEYIFSEIVDVPGERHINRLLQNWQTKLFHPPKGEPRMLPNTVTTIGGNQYASPYDQNDRNHYYPKPFLFLLKEKKEQNVKSTNEEEILSIFNQKISVLQEPQSKDWNDGLYLCFLDISGEHCIDNVEEKFHVHWPLLLEQYHIQIVVYDPHSSRQFIGKHNEINPQNQWNPMQVKDVENNTIWNMVEHSDKTSTLVLIAKFDECLNEFQKFLAEKRAPREIWENFNGLFQNGVTPDMQAVKQYSDILKVFLNDYIQDTRFTAPMNQIDDNVLVVPVSAMGMAPEPFEPENAELYSFPDCLPRWIEVPILWLIETLKQKSENDPSWLN